MKILFTLALACFMYAASAQAPNPTDLSGCWKVRHQTVYERWDLLNISRLSGLSYAMDSLGNMKPIEYLKLEKGKKAWHYLAKVLGQSQGRTIYFTWQPCDKAVLFVNEKHDFPKQIS